MDFRFRGNDDVVCVMTIFVIPDGAEAPIRNPFLTTGVLTQT